MDLSCFVWSRAVAGYRVIELETPPADARGAPIPWAGQRLKYLTTKEPTLYLGHFREDRPLNDPALFRTFAGLEASPGAITRFADAYGMLGKPERRLQLEFDGPVSPRGLLPRGEVELLGDWLLAVERMRRTVGLWEALKDGRGGAVQEELRAAPLPLVGRFITEGQRDVRILETVSGIQVRPWAVWSQAPPEHQGWALLQERLNWFLGIHRPAPLTAYDLKQRRLRLVTLPDSLLGALWLQFGNAVDEELHFRKCAVPDCRQWFEVGKGAARRSRRFCSDGCRVKMFYRERKEKGQ